MSQQVQALKRRIKTQAPRFRRTGKMSAAVEYSGISRSSLYVIAGKYEGLFLKFGDATLVDFDVLDQVLDELPVARIKT